MQNKNENTNKFSIKEVAKILNISSDVVSKTLGALKLEFNWVHSLKNQELLR